MNDPAGPDPRAPSVERSSPPSVPDPEPGAVKRDFLLLIASRVSSRLGDGFLRILAVLLVAAKSKDPMVGAGQASQAVGVDAILNRYSDAAIQGRAKSTTSFGSRLSGLVAIGVVYFLVSAGRVEPRVLFGWLGVFPIIGAFVFFLGWMAERSGQIGISEVADGT